MLHGCDISPKAIIGRGFNMNHTVGIVIGGGVVAGENLRLFQNVTIGTRNEWTYPIIGNDVTIFSGAACLGGIKIGDHCIIGANSVVIDNCKSGSTIVGVPGKVINQKFY